MIRILEFELIRICNLFSYYAPDGRAVEIDLGGSDPGGNKNIVLIGGRNGFGKTSLLNCIRLLFYGPSRPVREAALRVKRSLADTRQHASSLMSVKAFLLGVSGEWDGIFNTRARSEAQQEYFVEIRWRERGGIVIARRSWTLRADSFVETLRIKGPGAEDLIEETVIDKGRAFLLARLPEHYGPFYMFDGEDLQYLAERLLVEGLDKSAAKHLLGIARIEELRETLEEIARSLPRRAKVNATEWDLENLKQKRHEAQGKLVELEEYYADIRHQLQVAEERLSEIQPRLSRLRERGIGGQNARELEIERDALRADLNRWSEEIGRDLLPFAPLLSRPELIEAALQQAQSQLDRPDLAGRRIIESIRQHLPQSLFEPPHSNPPLTRVQQEFYYRRLENKLEEYLSAATLDESSTQMAGLSSERLRELVQRIAPFARANEVHRNWKRRLHEIADRRVRLEIVENRLHETGDADERESREFEGLVREEVELTRQLRELQQELSGLPTKRKTFEQSISAWDNQIRKLQSEVKDRQETQDRGYLARDLARGFFRDYQRELERSVIWRLSEACSSHWDTLMTSHRLIKRLEFDPTMTLQLFDSDGKKIGGRSISEGMKQLAATAFLWSLSELTGSRMPVIVDTPLGRVDEGHQRNLLERYFPRAARQVILLPTDSEIDERKYSLIRDHVYKAYRIVNMDGRSAHIEEGWL